MIGGNMTVNEYLKHVGLQILEDGGIIGEDEEYIYHATKAKKPYINITIGNPIFVKVSKKTKAISFDE
jgi:hypothetical protein